MNRLSWANITAVLMVVLDSLSVSWALASSSYVGSRTDHHRDPTLSSLPDKYTAHLRAKIAHSVAKGERRASEREVQLRPVCQTCSRPDTICVCNVLPSYKLSTQNTQILILQHPNERRKKNLSTVPLLRLVLENVQVVVGYTFEDMEALPGVKELLDKGRKPLLLYPREDALSLDNPDDLALLSQDDISERGICNDSQKGSDKQQQLLILVDGTWTEAKRMVRDSPTLVGHCQAIQFTSDTQSLYDALRREPEEHCLSTLEACVQALDFLEDDTLEIQETLLRVLQAHVDAHLANSRIMAPRSVGAAVKSLDAKNKRRQEIELSMFPSDTGELPTTARQDLEEAHTKGNNKSGNEVISRTDLHGFVWQRLPDGAVLRSLQSSDAPLVDYWWEYRSSKSLPLIVRRIQQDQGGGCCLGVEVQGNLVASIMRYEGGAVGMLYVLESTRRKGYGTALLQQVTRVLEHRGEERVAFVVDGNHASQNLFRTAGWEPADATKKRQTGKRRSKRKWVHSSRVKNGMPKK